VYWAQNPFISANGLNKIATEEKIRGLEL